MADIYDNDIKKLIKIETAKFNNESGKIAALYRYFIEKMSCVALCRYFDDQRGMCI